ncbi:helix-turn-helix domain-containing protein [Bacillus sp. FJAT-51639]|uniref:Helix-turn-helix domain-containing protein n=1 Tax=Bacillus bruguierae TaxID=3127667 RepID=A0ABU8FP68_9BACI
MNKEHIIELISNKIRLIRLEKGYSQDKMSKISGISKKTLVQIEKGRTLSEWTIVIAICALFRDSEVLQSLLGDEPLEVVETIAHDGLDRPKNKTMGGRVWWKEIDKKGSFLLQQNLVSQQYRWFSSFDKQENLIRLSELANGE